MNLAHADPCHIVLLFRIHLSAAFIIRRDEQYYSYKKYFDLSEIWVLSFNSMKQAEKLIS